MLYFYIDTSATNAPTRTRLHHCYSCQGETRQEFAGITGDDPAYTTARHETIVRHWKCQVCGAILVEREGTKG